MMNNSFNPNQSSLPPRQVVGSRPPFYPRNNTNRQEEDNNFHPLVPQRSNVIPIQGQDFQNYTTNQQQFLNNNNAILPQTPPPLPGAPPARQLNRSANRYAIVEPHFNQQLQNYDVESQRQNNGSFTPQIPNQISSNQITYNQINYSGINSNQINTNQFNPNQNNLNQVNPHQLISNQVNPNQFHYNQVNPNQVNSNQINANAMNNNFMNTNNQLNYNQINPTNVNKNQTNNNLIRNPFEASYQVSSMTNNTNDNNNYNTLQNLSKKMNQPLFPNQIASNIHDSFNSNIGANYDLSSSYTNNNGMVHGPPLPPSPPAPAINDPKRQLNNFNPTPLLPNRSFPPPPLPPYKGNSNQSPNENPFLNRSSFVQNLLTDSSNPPTNSNIFQQVPNGFNQMDGFLNKTNLTNSLKYTSMSLENINQITNTNITNPPLFNGGKANNLNGSLNNLLNHPYINQQLETPPLSATTTFSNSFGNGPNGISQKTSTNNSASNHSYPNNPINNGINKNMEFDNFGIIDDTGSLINNLPPKMINKLLVDSDCKGFNNFSSIVNKVTLLNSGANSFKNNSNKSNIEDFTNNIIDYTFNDHSSKSLTFNKNSGNIHPDSNNYNSCLPVINQQELVKLFDPFFRVIRILGQSMSEQNRSILQFTGDILKSETDDKVISTLLALVDKPRVSDNEEITDAKTVPGGTVEKVEEKLNVEGVKGKEGETGKEGIKEEEEEAKKIDHLTRQSKTIVYIKITYNKIAEIDTLHDRFNADITLQARWKEPRLDGMRDLKAEEINWKDYWNPKLFVENAIGDNQGQVNHFLSFDSSGQATIRQIRRLKGAFQEFMELNQFPFDSQDLTVSLTSEYLEKEVELVEDMIDCCMIVVDTFASEQEWHLWSYLTTQGRIRTDDNKHPKTSHSAFSCGAGVSRKPDFFIWNILLVMFLICSLAFATFAVDNNLPQNRLQLAFILVLTTVSFKFVVNQSLPMIAYLTYMDKYILTSMGILMLICVWHSMVPLLNQSSCCVVLAAWGDKCALMVFGATYIGFHLIYVLSISFIKYTVRKDSEEKEEDQRKRISKNSKKTL